EMMLSPNYPNPFNNETRMILSLPQRGPLQVEVTDLLGRCVRRLYQGEAREGYLDLHWDGRDDLGKTAASGIYYCRVVAGKQTLSRKLVLVR
ncbi:MAG TPA: T9SS type A sorting domain-containing protein, partial [bacterium]|nr:T9SS type A sorting domain-containing protein [bacterium]